MTLRRWYERRVLPHLVDVACRVGPVRRQREKLVPLARGQVLEVGIGTGLNLPHYDKTHVARVVGLDPGLEMQPLARQRGSHAGLPVELLAASAEHVPFDAATFDTVVVTYSLCTIPDPVGALKEMRRVLKRDGRLIFCEHGLAPDPAVRRWQRRLTPVWSTLAGGCHLDRDIPALLAEAGFKLQDFQAGYLPGPRIVMFNVWGTAGRGP